MSSISPLSDAMQQVLIESAKRMERSTGFVQRSTAVLDGPLFAQTTTLTWMDHA